MKKDMFLDSFARSNFDDESDFFPLLSSVDEEKINKEEVPSWIVFPWEEWDK